MNANECGMKLAFDYQVPLFYDNGGRNVPNKQVYDAILWIEKNVPEQFVEKFYTKVKEHFRPTAGTPYPLLVDFVDINKFDQYPHPPKFERDGTLLEYANTHNITYDPPDDVKDVPLPEVYHDETVLTFNEMLKKYGVRLTYEAVKHNEQEREI